MSQTAAGPITLYKEASTDGMGRPVRGLIRCSPHGLLPSAVPVWHGEDMHCTRDACWGATGVPGGRVAGARLHAQRGGGRIVTVHTETGGLCVWNMALAIAVAIYLLFVCSLSASSVRRFEILPPKALLPDCPSPSPSHQDSPPERQRHRGTPRQ